VGKAERRLVEIDAQVAENRANVVSKADVTAALADFDSVWNALSPKEQARVLTLLIGRVEFDAVDNSIEVSFHPSGIKALGEEVRAVEDAA
jgi:site-specific DNA recombinase